MSQYESIPANCYHEKEGYILWWKLPIDIRYVRFALRTLLSFPDPETGKIDKAEHLENKKCEIYNVCVKGFTERDVIERKDGKKQYKDRGAVFFYEEEYLKLHGSWYPVRFSIPKTNLLEYETVEKEIPQKITITEWAYENCYKRSIDRILEDWGKTILTLIKRYSNGENIKNESNYPLIERIVIKSELKQYNKELDKNKESVLS